MKKLINAVLVVGFIAATVTGNPFAMTATAIPLAVRFLNRQS